MVCSLVGLGEWFTSNAVVGAGMDFRHGGRHIQSTPKLNGWQIPIEDNKYHRRRRRMGVRSQFRKKTSTAEGMFIEIGL
jgi:hypothetical protein